MQSSAFANVSSLSKIFVKQIILFGVLSISF